MKRLLPLLALLSVGCEGTLRARYAFDVVRAERSTADGTPMPLRLSGAPGADQSVSDDSVELAVAPSSAGVVVSLTNRSPGTLRILWDEAALVNPASLALRPSNTGIQAVPAGATLMTALVPGSSLITGKPSFLPDASPSGLRDEEFRKSVQAIQGREVRILLPVLAGAVRSEYMVTSVARKAEVLRCFGEDCGPGAPGTPAGTSSLYQAPQQDYKPPQH